MSSPDDKPGAPPKKAIINIINMDRGRRRGSIKLDVPPMSLGSFLNSNKFRSSRFEDGTGSQQQTLQALEKELKKRDAAEMLAALSPTPLNTKAEGSFACGQPDCKYVTKRRDKLKQHRRDVHGIDVVWYPCTFPGCGYKAKRRIHLKQHKAHAHDIDVVWYPCEIDGCDFKTKKKSNLKEVRWDGGGAGEDLSSGETVIHHDANTSDAEYIISTTLLTQLPPLPLP